MVVMEWIHLSAYVGDLRAVVDMEAIRRAKLHIGVDPLGGAENGGAWLKQRAGTVTLALSLLPFAGIAFLWFMGVVRDLLTVFFRSGLLFLPMMLASVAIASGTPAT
jgi:phosphoglucomutase